MLLNKSRPDTDALLHYCYYDNVLVVNRMRGMETNL
jgi:hypothetical protein